jgi:hypothetical protein
MTSSQRPLPDNTQYSQETDIHAAGGIRTHNLSRQAATGTGGENVTSRKYSRIYNAEKLYFQALESMKVYLFHFHNFKLLG